MFAVAAITSVWFFEHFERRKLEARLATATAEIATGPPAKLGFFSHVLLVLRVANGKLYFTLGEEADEEPDEDGSAPPAETETPAAVGAP